MKRLLALLALVFPLVAFAQSPILRNSITTNTLGNDLLWVPIFKELLVNGNATGGSIVVSSNSGGGVVLNAAGNGIFAGSLFLTGQTNQLSMNSSNLLFNGHAVLTNAPGGGITNSGVGTNNYLTKWTGTNSLGTSQFSDDGTNITTDAGNFLLSTDLSTSGVMALGGVSLNPNAALTLFTPMAWSDSSGPYINGSLSGGVDVFTLGLASGAGSTKITQRITAAQGLTSGLNLELFAGPATDGSGGRVTIRASAGAGIDQDGADVRIIAGNATGSGTDGKIILTAGTAGVVDVANSLVLDTVTASTLLKADSGQIVTSIANAVGILTNDGSGGLGFSTNISQAITINNFTVTNLTVQSNLVVNQSIKLQGKELGSTHINGTNVFPVVNITNTSSVTWAVSGSNITATASGATAQSFVSLPFSSSTNLSTMDCSLGSSSEVHFYTVLTNNAFLGTPSNIPSTVKQIWWHIQQDSTGIRLLTMTNGTFAHPDQQPFVLSTNGGAVDIVQMVTDPFTNTVLNVVGTQNFKR